MPHTPTRYKCMRDLHDVHVENMQLAEHVSMSCVSFLVLFYDSYLFFGENAIFVTMCNFSYLFRNVS